MCTKCMHMWYIKLSVHYILCFISIQKYTHSISSKVQKQSVGKLQCFPIGLTVAAQQNLLREYTFQLKGPPQLSTSSYLSIRVLSGKRQQGAQLDTNKESVHEVKWNFWKGHWTIKQPCCSADDHGCSVSLLHRLHTTRELLMFNSCSSFSQHKASVPAVGLQRPGDQAVTNNQATAASAVSQPVDTLGRASVPHQTARMRGTGRARVCFPLGIVEPVASVFYSSPQIPFNVYLSRPQSHNSYYIPFTGS